MGLWAWDILARFMFKWVKNFKILTSWGKQKETKLQVGAIKMKAQGTEIPVSGFKCSWKKPVQSQITSIKLLKPTLKEQWSMK